MSSSQRTAAVLAIPLCLAACQSSPPTHYFALSEVAPATVHAVALPEGMTLQVERVSIPGELDRLEMVRHGESSQLHIATFDVWAAPLDEMIRRVLSEDLGVRLAAGTVVSLNAPAGGTAQQLYLDIQEFAGDEHGMVKLRAGWVLKKADGTESRDVEELSVSAETRGADALAAAMSRALGSLADRLSTKIGAQAPGTKSP
jgi:uncharacterized lipoprotein YmbA